MRLISTSTLEIFECFDHNTPAYAILSHTWGEDEVTLEEMTKDHQLICWAAGYQKIVRFCALASQYGIKYAWVDTCCIDKRNSAELSEAINSMYRYYHNAAECFVYLVDVPVSSDSSGMASRAEQFDMLKRSRWFTRGWTLQELIAPSTRRFFASDWSLIDDSDDMINAVAEAADIDGSILRNRDLLPTFCIAERMSRVSKRQTTRSEDIVYSLMGIFDVAMPVLYGEGVEKAFRRLQIEIIQTSFDQTIFAWRSKYESSGLLAQAPDDFAQTPQLSLWGPTKLSPYFMTNIGLVIRLFAAPIQEVITASKGSIAIPDGRLTGENECYLAALQCDIRLGDAWNLLLIYLLPIVGSRVLLNGVERKAFRRILCNTWISLPQKSLPGSSFHEILVLQDEHFELFERAQRQNSVRWGTVPRS